MKTKSKYKISRIQNYVCCDSDDSFLLISKHVSDPPIRLNLP